MSALTISLGGLQRASTQFEKAAQRIANPAASQSAATEAVPRGQGAGTPASAAAPAQSAAPGRDRPPSLVSDDTTAAIVDLLQAEHSFKANARVAGRIADLQEDFLDTIGD